MYRKVTAFTKDREKRKGMTEQVRPIILVREGY
jgi:hypothetical protein